jgi:hypothetical protein
MPISFNTEEEQVCVDFTGGDIIAGLCGEEEDCPDSVGISESPVVGKSGALVPEEVEAAPAIVLKFHTQASLDSFIGVLLDLRKEKFGEK